MFTVLAMLSTVRYHQNRHIWDVPLSSFEDIALLAWLSELAFLISTSCTKVSVLLFYRRLVEGTFSKRWKWATIAAIAFTICYCLAFVFALVLNCTPTDAYWKAFSVNPPDNYHCTNTKVLNPVSGVMSVVSDLYSVLLPMGMLRHFETDRRKKIALNCVFSLGLLVVAAGAVRTYYLNKLGYTYDVTWIGFDVLVWAVLEVQLAIICASAPALRVLFRQYLKDPISRAMHTASGLSRSAVLSTRRSSRQTASTTVVSYSRKNESLDLGGVGDKSLVKHSLKPSLGTVGEQEIESPSSTTPSEPNPINTPVGFEAYALQDLEANHPQAAGRIYSRPDHNRYMKPRLSEPFADWKPPRSWLNTDSKD